MGADAPRNSEFSRAIVPSEIGTKELAVEIVADDAERAALAARFGVEAVSALDAALRVKWIRGGAYLRVSGRVRASVRQICVVTLDPFDNAVNEAFTLFFRPDADTGPAGREAPGDPSDEDDEAEPFSADSLDLGEIVAGELALAIDPYPRKPGAVLDLGPSAPDRAEPPEIAADGGGPFERLAALRGNK